MNSYLNSARRAFRSLELYELEQMGDTVKLAVIHEMAKPDSKFIGKVSNGWPSILSSLKSLLETSESLEFTLRWPKGV